jgi:ribosomal protein S18 acetylase RimI-like enzyme
MALEVRAVTPEWEKPLAEFFEVICESHDPFFHPHPFTGEFAKTIAYYRGKDLYYLLVDEKEILAYGMLRGWDEGYEVPSLGIVVRPKSRGSKLGELMMHFLHAAARRNGARHIRLKVYAANTAARSLYERLGYQFAEEAGECQLVGKLQL